MHFSGVDPIQASQPAGQATIPVVSRKNFGAAAKHSPAVAPKQSAQFAVQGVIEVIAEFDEVRAVPTKYFPHPSFGAQSISVGALVQVHLSVL